MVMVQKQYFNQGSGQIGWILRIMFECVLKTQSVPVFLVTKGVSISPCIYLKTET